MPSVGVNLARVAILIIDDHCLSDEDLARFDPVPIAGKGKGKEGDVMKAFGLLAWTKIANFIGKFYLCLTTNEQSIIPVCLC